MNKDWFKDWFASKDYLDVYSHRNSEDTNNLIDLIISYTQIKPNAKILDAACGAGRHSIKLAQNKFNVTGFDLSETLLDVAMKEATLANVNINFLRSDLRTFYSTEKFDLILSLFTSFGYFSTEKENFAFAKNAFKMLNKNGYYVLDYLNKDYLEENLIEESERSVADKKIIEKRRIVEGRIIKKITIEKEDNSSEFIESVQLYSYQEIVIKFGEIGFYDVQVFGDYLGSKFDKEKSERCIIIFQKY